MTTTTVFTPYAKEYTRVYFEAMGIEVDDAGRLVFAELVHDGPITDEYTEGVVLPLFGDHRYNVYVMSADCGASCRCAAEIKLGEHPSREYRRTRTYTDDQGYIQHDWEPIPCGEWHDGNVYCKPHYEWYNKLYPQGWRSYPGDVCRHGMYTGGSGIDWMCGQCEMGDDEPQLTDSEAIGLLVRFVRTPEWSASMLEDIADIIRLARPDIGPDFDPEDPQCWIKH